MTMQLYYSDFTTSTVGGRTVNITTAQANGATGPMIPVTAARALVASRSALATPLPAGVTFLCVLPDDLPALVPDNVVTFVNTQLGRSYPLQTYTWRQFLLHLFDALGYTTLRFTDEVVT